MKSPDAAWQAALRRLASRSGASWGPGFARDVMRVGLQSHRQNRRVGHPRDNSEQQIPRVARDDSERKLALGGENRRCRLEGGATKKSGCRLEGGATKACKPEWRVLGTGVRS